MTMSVHKRSQKPVDQQATVPLLYMPILVAVSILHTPLKTYRILKKHNQKLAAGAYCIACCNGSCHSLS